ncbi:SDR family oxidoreductase [Amycolatopsis sp. GM8]|uniref:SDR family oxidoreductase n=1 Tax=Amycolatopsis sp. GM8 TaxID=2896530 RepID=UPI002103BF73|nr:SDR family oxidoreductase [Amycolatopsis sp. GM8]
MCEGRVAIVTGAGRGIGRAHALELGRQGARVVVNDLGGAKDGSGEDGGPAEQVAAEIIAAGGTAVANTTDVSDWDNAKALVDQAVEAFGRLDVLVNNAGIVRDRTIASMTEGEWDSVIRVHLRGTVSPAHFAVRHWRARAKETGKPVDARLINTSSASGLFGNFGQSNYGAAKAGIAAFTVIAAMELASYGVTANAISPVAQTRLTQGVGGGSELDLRPEHVAPVVAWLASTRSSAITGRVFLVGGGRIGVLEGWRLGPEAARDSVWTVDEIDTLLPKLVGDAAPNADIWGHVAAGDK